MLHITKKQISQIQYLLFFLLILSALQLVDGVHQVLPAAGRSISVVGDIALYDIDGITPFYHHDFPLFTPSRADVYTRSFIIRNIGTHVVKLYWNITTSSIPWTVQGPPLQKKYNHRDTNRITYRFGILQPSVTKDEYWSPITEDLMLAAGCEITVTFRLEYTGASVTTNRFQVTTSFFATPMPAILPATIDVIPNTLSLNATRQWLACLIQLPPGTDLSTLDLASIRLNDTIPIALQAPTHIRNRQNEILVRFDHQEVMTWLNTLPWISEETRHWVWFKIAGTLGTTSFEGYDLVQIISR